jgi:predicted nucleotidyltransferase
MPSEANIQQVVDRLAELARPSKIILFGSYARGDADAESDVDLMVIEPKVPDRGMEMLRLREFVGNIGVGVDVLVYSEQEAAKRGQVPGTLIYWALKEGKVLYDAKP